MTTTYDVAGMTCGHCVASITKEVVKVEGVQLVKVDLETGRVTITSDMPVDSALVAAAVDEAGYAVTGVSS
ncbi:heavy-metal-associated domain-containing protein [Actinotalea subterranea]|uniref:heavy-metal-associated domain-containing protein n=1 Tax=Actinotalea subterranea TaxID=2607497 RepID=UPI0011EBFDB4|nr:heavy metal-associated domain-containing protein [Actinotalea subterranea]